MTQPRRMRWTAQAALMALARLLTDQRNLHMLVQEPGVMTYTISMLDSRWQDFTEMDMFVGSMQTITIACFGKLSRCQCGRHEMPPHT